MDVAYRFNGFRIDPVRRLLFGPDGQPIALNPRVFDTLLYLVEHRGELLEKQTLLDAIWPNVVVEENNLNKAISALRAVFGETRGENSFIVTEPGRGYRFVAEVETAARGASAPSVPAPSAPAQPAKPMEPATPTPPTEPRSVELPRLKLALTAAAVLVAAVGLFAVVNAYRSTDVDSPGASRPSVPSQSVAVLPFVDLSESGDRSWLVDGLTEEILNSLAQVTQLKVAGRTSSFLFRNAQSDVGEIAERLGVAHVLEGSVRFVGDELRVAAKLIRAQDGFQVWSNTYDGRAGELLDFQREVAERVAAALDIVLDERLRARMFAGGTRNVEAFEAYQQGVRVGIDALNGRSAVWDAIPHFERALTLDPGYALAALGKATVLQNVLVSAYAESPYSQVEALEGMRAAYGFVAANGATPTMRLVADINLESLSPTWHRMPGLLNQLRAENDFDSVLLGGDGANWLPVVLAVTNERELRQALAERHVATDPLAVNAWIRKATSEYHWGEYAAARNTLAEARRVVGRLPVYDLVEYNIARREGKRDEAIAILSGSPQGPNNRMLLAAIRGDYETALRVADELEAAGQPPSTGQSWLVDTYYEAGATERLRALVKRIDDSPQGTPVLMSLLLQSGLVFDLGDTPNFAAKLGQAGLDPTTYMQPLPRLSAGR